RLSVFYPGKSWDNAEPLSWDNRGGTRTACQRVVPGQLREGRRCAVAVHSRSLDIASQIRARIEAGQWEPGAKLPRLNDLAQEYAANRDTVGRAIAELEKEGYVWAVQGRGITVRHGTIRPRRPRGNLVKRNAAGGYSFPSASAQEVWKHH